MGDELTTLVNLVRRMREAQKLYFRTRDHNAMLDSRRYEGLVDKFINEFDKKQKCPELFQETLF